MSWHYLQELAVESWEGSCLDGAPDALLRLIPTPGASCWPDSETGSCPDSPSGMTCEPSTASPGADRSMSSAADSPAKTSAQPVAGQVSRASAPASGQKWPESWVKWCPDSSLWKTRQCSLLGGLESFSGTWPRWGMMRGGECWEPDILEPLTRETGSGSWLATPTAKANQLAPSMQQKHPGCAAWWPTPQGHGGQLDPVFPEYLMGWPIGWTDCEPLEMGRFWKWLDLHGKP